MLDVMYDQNSDVLYIRTKESRIAYSDETDEGIDLRFDDKTHELCGATIEQYQRRWGRKRNSLVGTLADSLGVDKRLLAMRIQDATTP